MNGGSLGRLLAPLLCLILVVPVGLGVLVVVAGMMNYHPDQMAMILAYGGAACCLLMIVIWLAVRHIRRGKLLGFPRILSVFVGSSLVAFGLYGFLFDAREWIWVALLGSSVIWMSMSQSH